MSLRQVLTVFGKGDIGCTSLISVRPVSRAVGRLRLHSATVSLIAIFLPFKKDRIDSTESGWDIKANIDGWSSYASEVGKVLIYVELLVRRLVLHDEPGMFQCNYFLEKMMFLIQFPEIALILTCAETKTGVGPHSQGNLFPDIVNNKILDGRH